MEIKNQNLKMKNFYQDILIYIKLQKNSESLKNEINDETYIKKI